MKRIPVFVKIILAVMFVILLVVIGIVIYLLYFYPQEKPVQRNNGRYYVACDDKVFRVGLTNHMYMPGYDVPLIFPVYAADKSYSFEVEGAESFTANYYPGTGYLVMFEMPENKVSVTYEAHDLDGETLMEPEGEISFVMYENPSTGFEWEYTLSVDGIIENIEDKYVNDPVDPDSAEAGGGGTHFWKFQTIGSGIVEIHFRCLRGEEEVAEEITYRYECDGTNAVIIE